MCAGAILVNKMPRVVVGKMHDPLDQRWGDYTVFKLLDMVNNGTHVETGVLESECTTLLREWDIKLGRVPVS